MFPNNDQIVVYSNTIINHPKKLNLFKKKSEYNHLTIISRVKKIIIK